MGDCLSALWDASSAVFLCDCGHHWRREVVLKYRAEIDGLRALAVIPVILFHAGFDLFSGGFVGVDIFFVISGYLITAIIIADIESNRFSILRFYERRARRILPALFFVMLVCIPFAWLWMTPKELQKFSESLFAISFFSSNFLFWTESGYFATAAEFKPLLHTWSLAVEEQYYLLFPVFLLFAWRFGRNKVFWMIVVLLLASLWLSEWASGQGGRIAGGNFYLFPTRAWELFAGSLSAFIIRARGIKKNNALALIGLLAIIFSIFFYSEATPFPSLYALVPVGGTVLLILFSDEATLASKILSQRFIVALGLVSYSAYLWHQPLFAFARLLNTYHPSPFVMAFLSLFAFFLAYFSWKYIETPFRRKRDIKPRAIFLFSFSGLLAFSAIGIYGHLSQGLLNPYFKSAPNVEYLSLGDKVDHVGDICDFQPLQNAASVSRCDFGDLQSEDTVVLIGDSHAQSVSFSLDEQLKMLNKRGVFLSLNECQMIPYLHKNKRTLSRHCSEKFDAFLTYLEELNTDVVLVGRWTVKFYPIDGVIDDLVFVGSEGNSERDDEYGESDVLRDGVLSRTQGDKKWALLTYIEKLAAASKRLFLVYPIPETGIDIEKHNRLSYQRSGLILDSISTSIDDYERRNAFVTGVFDELLVSQSNIVKIDPKAVFCNTFIPNRCAAQFNTVPYYYDDDHLSKEGGDLIIGEISALANWKQ